MTQEAINLPENITARTSELVEVAGRADIVDEETLGKGGDLVKMINGHLKAIEAERDSWVRPLNEQVRRINAKFKEMRSPLEEAKKEVNKRMSVYVEEREARLAEQRRIEQEQREARALEQAEQAQQSGDEEKAGEIIDAAINQKLEKSKSTHGLYGSSTSTRREWFFRVVKVEAIPIEFFTKICNNEEKVRPYDIPVLALDGKKIRDAVDAGRDIPGIELWQKVVAQVR